MKNNLYVTVAELIEFLQKEDQTRVVILQKESGAENGCSPLRSNIGWTGMYRPESTYSGEMGLEELTSEDREAGYSEEDVFSDGIKALLLIPIH